MRKRAYRLIFAIAPTVILLVAIAYSLLVKPFDSTTEFCWVYRHTKICCPSCGITRALYCFFHGNFKLAFYYHALFTVGVIPSVILLTAMGVNFALGEKGIALLKYRWIYFYLALAVLIAFTVYRNLTVAIL